MKSKQQKRQEALDRIQKNLDAQKAFLVRLTDQRSSHYARVERTINHLEKEKQNILRVLNTKG